MSGLVSLLLERPALIPVLAIGLVLAAHVLPWLIDVHGLRQYPGPPLAAFSDFWLAWQCRWGSKYRVVDQIHRRYGPIVRLGPRHLSVADPEAYNSIYGHGTGTLKTDFYHAFRATKGARGLFNSTDRAEHTRKRKIVSHTFAPASIREFEPYIDEVVVTFIESWDKHCAEAKKSGDGWWHVDALDWFNYLAFDVIGSLAFGEPFGMVQREADIAVVEREDGTTVEMQAVKILNERGEYSATLGCLPSWIRPFMPKIDPWFARGLASVNNLTGIARARVNKRLRDGNPTERKDLLARLQAAKDEEGKPMEVPELIAEALTQLIAGSDTTSNTSCAITFFISKNEKVKAKLQAELDAKFKDREAGVLAYEEVKDLDYLNACIQEGMRRHATSSMGLPRLITKDTQFKDLVLKKGVVASIPTYTVQHLDSVWGDPFVYRPERWIEADKEQRQRLEQAFQPFSYGPRSCVGRNVASMELSVFLASLFLRYDFEADPTVDELPTAEGFLRKPLYSQMKIKRRD